MVGQTGEITQLLQSARQGDTEAADRLFKAVYEDLRRIAHQRRSRNRQSQTLNTTALVHEAYLRLVDQNQAGASDRAHFFALASRAMRFVLIDYARRRTAQKRGGPGEDVALDTAMLATEDRTLDLLVLDDALEQLTAFSERLGRLVEYRFFGGLTYDEIAEITGLSVPTVKRDWERARAWLFRAMHPTDTT